MILPKKNKKPWPTKAAMQQIYEQQLWGTNNTQFYSGEGSHKLEIVNPYIKTVAHFLNSFKERLSVVDLGCGDFNIGKQLVPYVQHYHAVDIVPELIAFNKTNFIGDLLEFHCLDLAKDVLPKADCAILRQVLQHLSNTEVQQITPKLIHYKYIIVTEHLPVGNFKPNKDIISGQGIRLKKQSGINLLQPPFCLKVKKEEVLLQTYLAAHKGVVTTVLYEL